jgi:polyisoprenyl-teichoic acid--peptidoglycan teichoic acid transferase
MLPFLIEGFIFVRALRRLSMRARGVLDTLRKTLMMRRMVRWTIVGSAVTLAGVFVGFLLHFFFTHAGMIVGWPFPPGDRLNLLFMGLDRTVSEQNRNVELPFTRTTTLIGVSVDPASRRVNVLSIPRDTQTEIPGHGRTKINAAHAYGGTALTLRTVQNLTGVSFPYFFEITERGLTHLVDAVGGVNLYVDRDMDYDDNWDGLHIHLKKGYRRLGGKAAMEFLRFRHEKLGDIARINRGQRFIDALIDELRKPRVAFRLGRIYRVFREDVTTNLPPDQVIALGLFAARLPSANLVRATLPGAFDLLGSSDWIPDLPKDRDLVVRTFFDADPEALARTTIEIVDAAGARDALDDTLARLSALGVRVVRVTTTTDAAETVVVLHHGDRQIGNIVASAFGARLMIDRIVVGNGPDLTLTLALGPSGLPHTVVPGKQRSGIVKSIGALP